MHFYGSRVEYALHTILNLCFAGYGSRPSARDLADYQQLPVAYVRKILTQLRNAGLVNSKEGAHGGWQLARQPSDISILQIVDATSSGGRLFNCQDIRSRCALWSDDNPPKAAVRGVCALNAVMLSAEAVMRKELNTHTLAEVAKTVRQKSSKSNEVAIQTWFENRLTVRSSSDVAGDKCG